jgi:type III restriction enzyme
MDDPIVLDKNRAAAQWCKHASAHAAKYGGKPWSYLLIPHDKIQENMTLAGLVAKYTVS